MDINALLTALQAGGNIAMISLFFMMWSFDRRLVRIETTLMNRIITTDHD